MLYAINWHAFWFQMSVNMPFSYLRFLKLNWSCSPAILLIFPFLSFQKRELQPNHPSGLLPHSYFKEQYKQKCISYSQFMNYTFDVWIRHPYPFPPSFILFSFLIINGIHHEKPSGFERCLANFKNKINSLHLTTAYVYSADPSDNFLC